MATYSRREVHTKRVEFPVPAAPPWGACWVEVYKAATAAHQELAEAGRIKPGTDAPDNLIRIRSGDDEVIVSYEDTTTTDTPATGLRTLPVTWHPNAIRRAREHLAAITAASTDPDQVYRLPGGAITWQDLACLVDVATAVLDDEGGTTDADKEG